MSDIAETLQEQIDAHEKKGKLNSLVAVFVAITATFMALCNVKDGNIIQSMQQAQANMLDSWSYYQSKSTKEDAEVNTVDILKEQNAAGNEAIIEKYEEKIARYEKEKAEIKAQAEGYKKEY